MLAKQLAAQAFIINCLMLQRLADPVLDKKYAATIKQFDDKLVKQTIGVQIGTDGQKRKSVNKAQKIQNFLANFADGNIQFLSAHDTEVNIITKACAMSTSCVYGHLCIPDGGDPITCTRKHHYDDYCQYMMN